MVKVNDNQVNSYEISDDDLVRKNMLDNEQVDGDIELQAYFDDLLIPASRPVKKIVMTNDFKSVSLSEEPSSVPKNIINDKSFSKKENIENNKTKNNLYLDQSLLVDCFDLKDQKLNEPSNKESCSESFRNQLEGQSKIKNVSHSILTDNKVSTLRKEKKNELQLLLSKSVRLSDHKANLKDAKVNSFLDEKIDEKTAKEINKKIDEKVKDYSNTKVDCLSQKENQEKNIATVDASLEHLKTEQLSWCENGRPLWAQEKFQILLFEVSGLKLALPLVALGQIVNLDQKLTPIFGQSDWFMGLLPSPIGQLKVVNTALFVMPERYDEEFPSQARYAISLDGQEWALAVDSVNQPIDIHPDDVKWRSQRTSRPWLGGTVKEYMCALIDIPNMTELLNVRNL